ncbi:hypothetical protein VTK56DRAFT_6498 [Thermocarpiscus australiensis]
MPTTRLRTHAKEMTRTNSSKKRRELGEAAMRAVRVCPPPPPARSNEAAAQWAGVRAAEDSLRLRRHGAGPEHLATVAAMDPIASVAEIMENHQQRTANKLDSLDQQFAECYECIAQQNADILRVIPQHGGILRRKIANLEQQNARLLAENEEMRSAIQHQREIIEQKIEDLEQKTIGSLTENEEMRSTLQQLKETLERQIGDVKRKTVKHSGQTEDILSNLQEQNVAYNSRS